MFGCQGFLSFLKTSLSSRRLQWGGGGGKQIFCEHPTMMKELWQIKCYIIKAFLIHLLFCGLLLNVKSSDFSIHHKMVSCYLLLLETRDMGIDLFDGNKSDWQEPAFVRQALVMSFCNAKKSRIERPIFSLFGSVCFQCPKCGTH